MTTNPFAQAAPQGMTMSDLINEKVVTFASAAILLLAFGIIVGNAGVLAFAGLTGLIALGFVSDAAVRAMRRTDEPAEPVTPRVLQTR